MRGATSALKRLACGFLFQSTLLMRGATGSCRAGLHLQQYFNPRSSCEERRYFAIFSYLFIVISIHAPHARSDAYGLDYEQGVRTIFQSTLLMRGATFTVRLNIIRIKFQSTLLMRGATEHRVWALYNLGISIHAPHARSDQFSGGDDITIRIFQSTLLMRGATALLQRPDFTRQFQSTLLMRGATVGRCFWGHQSGFQSTLLMRGATMTY